MMRVCLSSFPVQSELCGTDRSSSTCVSFMQLLAQHLNMQYGTLSSSRQFLLSAQTTPNRRETPASGKVQFHDVIICTVCFALNGGVIKSCRHQNLSKKGSSHGKSEHEDPTFRFDEECSLCSVPKFNTETH